MVIEYIFIGKLDCFSIGRFIELQINCFVYEMLENVTVMFPIGLFSIEVMRSGLSQVSNPMNSLQASKYKLLNTSVLNVT